MNADGVFAHYERIADAPGAIPRLRRFILDLAVRGKLVERDPSDEPASELLKRITAKKARLVKAGKAKEGTSIPSDTDASKRVPRSQQHGLMSGLSKSPILLWVRARRGRQGSSTRTVTAYH